MKRFLLAAALVVAALQQAVCQRKTENLVIVTLDGMRWQEVFKGVDTSLLHNKKYTREEGAVTKDFWDGDITERRKKLFPFLWTKIVEGGQLYGNRMLKCNVNVANPYRFSYPGYNEIFTGFPDTAVNSNNHVKNKNETVLEFINRQKDYKNKVAVFSSWDCFPYILNKWRSNIYVNSDKDTMPFPEPKLRLINDMQRLSTEPLGLRPDALTYFAAREYLKAYRPKVLYIAFDETDDFAHAGVYDQYLKSAHAEDGMIADLWNTLQSLPQYKNKTTLVVTCDHGRGDKVKDQWTSHGRNESGRCRRDMVCRHGARLKGIGRKKGFGYCLPRTMGADICSNVGALLPGSASCNACYCATILNKIVIRIVVACKAISNVILYTEQNTINKNYLSFISKKRMAIKMVVFDMAGTTVDEDNIVYKTLCKAINQAGCDVTLAIVLELGAGKEKFDAIETVLRQYADIDDSILARTIYENFNRQLVDAYMTENIFPQPNALEVLKTLKAYNIVAVLNTGYNRQIAELILSRLGWKKEVEYDVLITADDVERSRPYPDMVLLAMHMFGIQDSKEVVKIGDSAVDIEEGKNANCGFSIGVLTGAHNYLQLQAAAPDYIIHHLGELLPIILQESFL